MSRTSSIFTAMLRALRGESDVHVVAPALDNTRFARILALAPNVDPVVGALGALAGGLLDLLTPAMCASPALHAAIASLIGTDAGARILPWWAAVAPAGWGASHADALIDAVRHSRCEPWTAAALIGPTNDAAALLTWPWDIARAVRYWGQATPDHPTAWMDNLTPAEQDRLLDAFHSSPNAASDCLPWLSGTGAADIVGRITNLYLRSAFTVYAIASPVARTRHAAILAALIQRAQQDNLDTLTRLAVASCMDSAWAKVTHLLHEAPNHADWVVTAAPWDDLDPDVQATILSSASHNDVCAAIAFARGVRPDPPAIAWKTARAFFAAVIPAVWDALPAEMQQAWRSSFDMKYANLAVRSLGADPMFMVHARFNNDVIAAVRRSTRDDGDLRQALLSIAVRDLLLVELPVVIAALPPPPDPVAFIQIACEEREMPPALRDWITAHPTPHAYGTAATILRAVQNRDLTARCTALMHALTGWSAAETDALLAALPDDARITLRTNTDVLADTLAHPNQQDAFRQTLDALDNLPSSVAIPALHALDALASTSDRHRRRQAGEGLAQALRDHGRIFATITGALNDAARSAILPGRDDPHVGSALDDLAAADPLVAHHLAHALRDANPGAARTALAMAPLEKTLHLWQLLPETLQHAVLGDRDALAANVAAEGQEATLRQTLQRWGTDDLLPLLALCMLIDDDEAQQARGGAILAMHPDLAAALLPLLRTDVRTLLASDLRIAVASADLPPPHPAPAPAQRRRR